MRKTLAVAYKQLKDSLHNKMALLVFCMFPVLAFVFKAVVDEAEFSVVLPTFLVMHTIMVPIILMSSLVSEEREKGTLRMLTMSGVGPFSYLAGIGAVVIVLTLLTAGAFIPLFKGNAIENMPSIAMGVIPSVFCSFLVGSSIALLVRNQMSAAPIAAPVALIIGMLPTFSRMNEHVGEVARYVYSQSAFCCFSQIPYKLSTTDVLVIVGNAAALLILFAACYRTRGLE